VGEIDPQEKSYTEEKDQWQTINQSY